MQKMINGTIVTCDRCGKTRIIRGKLANYGWRDVFEMDICPVCAKKLDDLIVDFMKSGEKVEENVDIDEILDLEACKNDQNSTES